MASSSSSAVAAPPPASVRWRPRQYVLAGMAAILAASTVAIVTSIVFRPARVNFSVTDARTTTTNASGNASGLVSFEFNLAARNPSHRAAVQYRDVVVNLQMSRRGRKRLSVQARVVVTMPFDQPPRNQSFMPVAGSLGMGLSSIFVGGKSPANVTTTLVVIALVRFRIGLAYTRLYDIRISCSPVDFFNVTYYAPSVNCIP